MAGVLALRLAPPLALGAAACAWLARAGWPAARVLGLVAPLLLCAVAPASPQVRCSMWWLLSGAGAVERACWLAVEGPHPLQCCWLHTSSLPLPFPTLLPIRF